MKRQYLYVAAVLAIAAAIATITGAISAQNRPAASGDILFVCQDEQTIEKAIAEYIEREKGVKADFGVSRTNTDNVYIRYTLEPDDAPKITLSIDTQVTNRSADKSRVTERAICFVAFFVLPDEAKTPEAQRKILELNNARMRDMWFPGRIYLDKDGDVAMETYINIPGTDIPLHAEMCYDVVARSVGAWREYYKALADIVPVKESK